MRWLADLALERLHQVLLTPVQGNLQERIATMKVVLSAIDKALNTQTKVDETALRQKQVSTLPELMRQLLAAKAGLPNVPTLELSAAAE